MAIHDPVRPGAAGPPGSLLFDRYRLLARIGVGGTADVWRAHDERLGRDAAVKLLHPHLLPDARSRERFMTEARAVAGLAHPGIVRIHDVLADDDQVALVLELVDGQSLAARIAERGPLPGVAAAAIAAQVAEALAAAHAQGVVHRDVKPANVLVATTGDARLVDFGIARALDAEQAGTTAPGTVMGTLRYMAPEQLAGAPPTAASDVFGLGAVLYEALAGRPPFAATTPVALLAQQRDGAPPILGADPELDRLARSALAATPQDRPAGARAVAEVLAGWLERRSIDARGWARAAATGLAAAPAVAGAIAAAPAPDPDLVDTVTLTAARAPIDGGVPQPLRVPVRRVAARRGLPRTAALALAALLVLVAVGAAAGGLLRAPAAGALDPSPSPRATVTAAPSPTPAASATAAPAVPVAATAAPKPAENKGPDKKNDGKPPKKPGKD